MKHLQSGRSMIEMIAVLAIIGVLTIAGFAGYSLSINRIRINSIMDVATKFASQGIGGKSYKSLDAAGLSSPEGIEMALDESGIVCLAGFKKSTKQDKDFFSAFRAQASNYITTDTFTRPAGTTITNCDFTLRFSQKTK